MADEESKAEALRASDSLIFLDGLRMMYGGRSAEVRKISSTLCATLYII